MLLLYPIALFYSLLSESLSRLVFPSPTHFNQVLNEGQSSIITHIVKILDSDLIATFENESKNLKIWEETGLKLLAWHKLNALSPIVDIFHIEGTYELCYTETNGNTVRKFNYLKGTDELLYSSESEIKRIKVDTLNHYILSQNTIRVFNFGKKDGSRVIEIGNIGSNKIEDFVPLEKEQFFFSLSDNGIGVYDLKNKTLVKYQNLGKDYSNELSRSMKIDEVQDCVLVLSKSKRLAVYNTSSFVLKEIYTDSTIKDFGYVYKRSEFSQNEDFKLFFTSEKRNLIVIDYSNTSLKSSIKMKAGITALAWAKNTNLIFVGDEMHALTVENYMKNASGTGSVLNLFQNVFGIKSDDQNYYFSGGQGQIWVIDQFSGKLVNKHLVDPKLKKIDLFEIRDDLALVFQENIKEATLFNMTNGQIIYKKEFKYVFLTQRLFKFKSGELGVITVHNDKNYFDIWNTKGFFKNFSINNYEEYETIYINEICLVDAAGEDPLLFIGTSKGFIFVYNLEKPGSPIFLEASKFRIKRLSARRSAEGIIIFALADEVNSKVRQLLKLKYVEGKLEKLTDRIFNDSEALNTIYLVEVSSTKMFLLSGTEFGKIFEVDQTTLEIGQLLFYGEMAIERMLYSRKYDLLSAYKEEKSPILVLNFKKGLIFSEKVNVAESSNVMSVRKTHSRNIWVVMFKNCSITTYNSFSRSFGSLLYNKQLSSCPVFVTSLQNNLIIFKEALIIKGINYMNSQVYNLYNLETVVSEETKLASIMVIDDHVVLASNRYYWIFIFESDQKLKRIFLSNVGNKEIKSIFAYKNQSNMALLGTTLDLELFQITVNTSDTSAKDPDFTHRGILYPVCEDVVELTPFFKTPTSLSFIEEKKSIIYFTLFWNASKKIHTFSKAQLNIPSVTGFAEAEEDSYTIMLIINQTEIALYNLVYENFVFKLQLFPGQKIRSVERNDHGDYLAIAENDQIVRFRLPFIEKPSLGTFSSLYPNISSEEDIADIKVDENLGTLYIALKNGSINILDKEKKYLIDTISLEGEILSIALNTVAQEAYLIVFHEKMARKLNLVRKKIQASYVLENLISIDPSQSAYFPEKELLCLASTNGFFSIFNTKVDSPINILSKGVINKNDISLGFSGWADEWNILGVSAGGEIMFFDAKNDAALKNRTEISILKGKSIRSMKFAENTVVLQATASSDGFSNLIYVNLSNLPESKEIKIKGLRSFNLFVRNKAIVVWNDENSQNISIWSPTNEAENRRVNLELFKMQGAFIGPEASKDSFLIYKKNNEREIIELNFRDTSKASFTLKNKDNICQYCYDNRDGFYLFGKGLYKAASFENNFCEQVGANFCPCGEISCSFMISLSYINEILLLILIYIVFA